MAMPRRCMFWMVVFVLAVSANVGPAHAVDGSKLLGHRCRTYPAERTNENTVAALASVSRVARAWCEVDVRTIADGTVIIWHDDTWQRVADHATLPSGVAPGSLVKDATWAQVRQIRTKGGKPVPTLGRMMKASGNRGVPLVVEIKDSLSSPRTWIKRARRHGARVRYYQDQFSSCEMPALDRMRNAGARIGLKIGDTFACEMTPAQMQAEGLSFLSLPGHMVTSDYTSQLSARGIKVYSRGATEDNARALLANGAARLLVNGPRAAATW